MEYVSCLIQISICYKRFNINKMTEKSDLMCFKTITSEFIRKIKISFNLMPAKLRERAEIGKQTGLKILRVVTPLWVQVPPLAPILQR